MNRDFFRLLSLSVVGFVLIVMSQPALAQTTQSIGLDFTTADTLVLENTGATVNMGAATATDYDNGYIDLATANDHTLNVAANTTWQVAVKGDTAELGEAWLSRAARSASANMPIPMPHRDSISRRVKRHSEIAALSLSCVISGWYWAGISIHKVEFVRQQEHLRDALQRRDRGGIGNVEVACVVPSPRR